MRLRRLVPRTIAAKLVGASLLVEVVMLSLLLLTNTRIMQASLSTQFETRLAEVEALLDASLSVPLMQRDYGTLQEVLDTVHSGHGIDFMELSDRNGRVLAAAGAPLAPEVPHYETRLPITLGGQVYGFLRLGVVTTFFRQARWSLLGTGVAIAVGEMVLSALILMGIAYRLTDRLRKVSRASAAVAGGDLAARLEVGRGSDEVDRLADSFNRMAEAMEARLAELKESQHRLELATAEAETARRRSELFLRTPEEGICGVDAQGRLVFINPAARRMYGWSEDEEADEAGLNMHVAVHHHHADGRPYLVADCPMARTLLDGEPRRIDNEVYWRKDGTSFPVEYSITAIRSEGRITGAVVLFRDISERLRAAQELERKSEQLARSNAELEQFAYVASHDLREPLRMISSYLSLIERRYGDRLDGEGHEFLAFARDGAVRMDQLVRDLLEFSRVGRQSAEPAPSSLAEAARLAVGGLSLVIAEAGAELRIAPDLPMVTGNPSELARLMQNLIGNALKYRADDRRPVIEVGWRPAQDMAEIWVADNGIGMEPQYFEQIFLIFKRLHDRQSHGGGSGIGLAVCKKIVEHHGGRIWVESRPGEGSTFRFTLPTPSPQPR